MLTPRSCADQFLGTAAEIQDLEDFGELDQALSAEGTAEQPPADTATAHAAPASTPAGDPAAHPPTTKPAPAQFAATAPGAQLHPPGAGPGLPASGERSAPLPPAHTQLEEAAAALATAGLGPLGDFAREGGNRVSLDAQSQGSDWLGADQLPKDIPAAAGTRAVTIEEEAGYPEADQEAGLGQEAGSETGAQRVAEPRPSSGGTVAELLPSGTELESAIESAAADVTAAADTSGPSSAAAECGAPEPEQSSTEGARAAPAAEPEPDQAPGSARAADSAKVLAAAESTTRSEQAGAERAQPDNQSGAAESAAQAEAGAEAQEQAQLAAGAADAAEFVLADEGADPSPKPGPGEAAATAAEAGAEGLTPGERLLHWEETLVDTPASSLLGADAAPPGDGAAAGGAAGHGGPASGAGAGREGTGGTGDGSGGPGAGAGARRDR